MNVFNATESHVLKWLPWRIIYCVDLIVMKMGEVGVAGAQRWSVAGPSVTWTSSQVTS